MTVFVTLLRAINVGGTGKLAMRDLIHFCESAGFRHVRTYIASGNVVFESDLTEADWQGHQRSAPQTPATTRSRTQGLLSQGGSDTVEVGALVRAELAAHVDGAEDRLTASGPTVYLRARQLQNFALALHELTTNAVKYGALKSDTGRLATS